MDAYRFAVATAVLFPLLAAAAPEVPKVDPLKAEFEERAAVRLVILDTVVVDADGRTVPGLTLDDFELTVDGKPRPLDTLDLVCAAGGVDDPRGVRRADRRRPLPAGGQPRRIVVALDYLHLHQLRRVQVLDQARRMIEHGLVDGDEVMLVALTGGVRVEQPFTGDRRILIETLQRMEYDISLWQPSFAHATEKGFLRGLETLFEVLTTVTGPKALVLYSDAKELATDNDYAELATASHAARCKIYPVSAKGLDIPPPPG